MSDTTEPQALSIEDAVNALISPEPETEEVEAGESEELEAEAEDGPVEEQTDEDEDETEDDDAQEVAGEDSDEQDEDDADEEVEADPALFTVKVDGEDVQVSREELTRGYAGQAYIQKGMKEVAETRKETETAFAAIQQERANLAQIVQFVQSGALVQPTPPPDAMINSDPIGYAEQLKAYATAQETYDTQVKQLQSVISEQSEAETAARQNWLGEQVRILGATIPGFADAQTAGDVKKRVDEIRSAAIKHYGVSEQEAAQIVDARHLQILEDARQWQELQAGKAEITQKVKKTKPTVKAAAKRRVNPQKKARDKQRQKLRETGSLDAAIALITET